MRDAHAHVHAGFRASTSAWCHAASGLVVNLEKSEPLSQGRDVKRERIRYTPDDCITQLSHSISCRPPLFPSTAQLIARVVHSLGPVSPGRSHHPVNESIALPCAIAADDPYGSLACAVTDALALPVSRSEVFEVIADAQKQLSDEKEQPYYEDLGAALFEATDRIVASRSAEEARRFHISFDRAKQREDQLGLRPTLWASLGASADEFRDAFTADGVEHRIGAEHTPRRALSSCMLCRRPFDSILHRPTRLPCNCCGLLAGHLCLSAAASQLGNQCPLCGTTCGTEPPLFVPSNSSGQSESVSMGASTSARGTALLARKGQSLLAPLLPFHPPPPSVLRLSDVPIVNGEDFFDSHGVYRRVWPPLRSRGRKAAPTERQGLMPLRTLVASVALSRRDVLLEQIALTPSWPQCSSSRRRKLPVVFVLVTGCAPACLSVPSSASTASARSPPNVHLIDSLWHPAAAKLLVPGDPPPITVGTALATESPSPPPMKTVEIRPSYAVPSMPPCFALLGGLRGSSCPAISTADRWPARAAFVRGLRKGFCAGVLQVDRVLDEGTCKLAVVLSVLSVALDEVHYRISASLCDASYRQQSQWLPRCRTCTPAHRNCPGISEYNRQLAWQFVRAPAEVDGKRVILRGAVPVAVALHGAIAMLHTCHAAASCTSLKAMGSNVIVSKTFADVIDWLVSSQEARGDGGGTFASGIGCVCGVLPAELRVFVAPGATDCGAEGSLAFGDDSILPRSVARSCISLVRQLMFALRFSATLPSSIVMATEKTAPPPEKSKKRAIRPRAPLPSAQIVRLLAPARVTRVPVKPVVPRSTGVQVVPPVIPLRISNPGRPFYVSMPTPRQQRSASDLTSLKDCSKTALERLDAYFPNAAPVSDRTALSDFVLVVTQTFPSASPAAAPLIPGAGSSGRRPLEVPGGVGVDSAGPAVVDGNSVVDDDDQRSTAPSDAPVAKRIKPLNRDESNGEPPCPLGQCDESNGGPPCPLGQCDESNGGPPCPLGQPFLPESGTESLSGAAS